ncbi:hypothetical protein K435DRAFT_874367 [Dendrothele bispora CBS 962.96]|uniref:Uncharacterized protein n=1 Tax=Dendrothele bispora (strain CBS 962.96) TaxID=1314807 RepID=A0A4V4HBS5_DENBC|nr:hypothetical protein K435DRAFT_874367 [Dendrothele bispora CBS 962.96]
MPASRRRRKPSNDPPSRTPTLDNIDDTDIEANPDDTSLPPAEDGLPAVSSIPATTSRSPRKRCSRPSVSASPSSNSMAAGPSGETGSGVAPQTSSDTLQTSRQNRKQSTGSRRGPKDDAERQLQASLNALATKVDKMGEDHQSLRVMLQEMTSAYQLMAKQHEQTIRSMDDNTDRLVNAIRELATNVTAALTNEERGRSRQQSTRSFSASSYEKSSLGSASRSPCSRRSRSFSSSSTDDLGRNDHYDLAAECQDLEMGNKTPAREGQDLILENEVSETPTNLGMEDISPAETPHLQQENSVMQDPINSDGWRSDVDAVSIPAWSTPPSPTPAIPQGSQDPLGLPLPLMGTPFDFPLSTTSGDTESEGVESAPSLFTRLNMKRLRSRSLSPSRESTPKRSKMLPAAEGISSLHNTSSRPHGSAVYIGPYNWPRFHPANRERLKEVFEEAQHATGCNLPFPNHVRSEGNAQYLRIVFNKSSDAEALFRTWKSIVLPETLVGISIRKSLQ